MNNVLKTLRQEDLKIENMQSGCSVMCRWLLEKLGPLKVIEIGTSYGRQLERFVPLSSETICVDTMYDWVPNVLPVEGFDPGKINQAKIDAWEANAEPFKDRVKLIVGNSFLVGRDLQHAQAFGGGEILIIDGCHHPAEIVMKDFENFENYMKWPHYVIWDDMDISDVKKAAEMASSYGCADHVDSLNTRVMYMSR